MFRELDNKFEILKEKKTDNENLNSDILRFKEDFERVATLPCSKKKKKENSLELNDFEFTKRSNIMS